MTRQTALQSEIAALEVEERTAERQAIARTTRLGCLRMELADLKWGAFTRTAAHARCEAVAAAWVGSGAGRGVSGAGGVFLMDGEA